MSNARISQQPDTSIAPLAISGLVSGTRVMTCDGALPVEYLTEGDRIVTRAGIRILASISMRLERDLPMVRVGRGTLGHDRPATETLVPLHQMILIRDWRAEALYGATQALVAAGRLCDGTMIKTEIVTEARIFNLQFADDVVIYADGLELACLREKVSS